MWSRADDAIVGASCGYAGAAIGGVKSPALSALMREKAYCGASPDLYKSGAGCGACYNLTVQATGRTSVVQVVNANSLAPGTLNCHETIFKHLTGHSTGTISTTLAQVGCGNGNLTATVLHAHEYYTKVVFSGLAYPVQGAEMRLADNRTLHMSRVADTAEWEVSHELLSAPVAFLVRLGEEEQLLTNCFGHVPAVGAVCHDSAPGPDA